MDSTRIYYTLCSSRKSLSEKWKPGSGLHRHHIVPRHSGGTDDDSNYTYLTPREHVIAHYLLWRIYRNPNDLRSMKMLGAELSVDRRRIIGLYCKDNGIGIWSVTQEQRNEWAILGYDAQKDIPNSFHYWSTPEGRKERASLGGKASITSGNNLKFEYWFSKDGIRERASMGAKAHIGKRCMYKPGDTSFKRVKPEDIESYLEQGYIFGSPIPGKNRFTTSSESAP